MARAAKGIKNQVVRAELGRDPQSDLTPPPLPRFQELSPACLVGHERKSESLFLIWWEWGRGGGGGGPRRREGKGRRKWPN